MNRKGARKFKGNKFNTLLEYTVIKTNLELVDEKFSVLKLHVSVNSKERL